jgi:exopolysaccharide biosynthesis polyprenyl glycosylphosphotransferase
VSGLGHSVELRREPAATRTWPRGWLLRRALLAADVAGLALTFALTEVIYGQILSRRPGVGLEFGLFLLTLPGWLVLAKVYGLYDRDETRTDHRTIDELVSVFHLVTVGTWIVFAGSRLTGIANPDLRRVTVFWGLAIGSIVLARSVARTICRRHESYVQNTVVVGLGSNGRLVARKLEQNPHYGLRLVGLVDTNRGSTVRSDPRVLGTIDDLPRLVRERHVGRVIVSCGEGEDTVVHDQIRELNAHGVQVDVLPPFYDLLGPEVDVHTAGGIPLWSLRPFRLSRSSLVLKRCFDVFFSALGLVLLAPAFVLIAILIKLESRGPVFFRQARICVRQRTFRMWKFRTMVTDAEERKADIAHLNIHARNGGDGRMFKAENDPRVTRVGRVLRRFSIDELPQLLNVLAGEMSLVGPRPLIPDENLNVTEWRRRRLDLKPGITGLWQVNGRSQAPFEEMVALDYRYVTNWSLWHDLELVLRTIPLVLRGGTGAQ